MHKKGLTGSLRELTALPRPIGTLRREAPGSEGIGNMKGKGPSDKGREKEREGMYCGQEQSCLWIALTRRWVRLGHKNGHMDNSEQERQG